MPETLEKTLAAIEKAHGKGSIMPMSDSRINASVDAIPTGSIALNRAIGIGGWPRGRICEIWGPEAGGKTTLALHAVVSAQRLGLIAAYIDMEHALDPNYAAALGVAVDDLLVSQPDYAEQALDIAEKLAASKEVGIVVVDSVAALVPKAELDGEIGEAMVGMQARLMSQAMRKLAGVVAKSNTLLLFINQVREKIGVMFGSNETTSGGRALKFAASVRVDIRRISGIKDGDVVVGNRTRAKVAKNKLAPPFREAEFDILFGRGICPYGDLVDVAVAAGKVEKSGAWYSYGGQRIGQGREQAKAFLAENADVLAAIEKDV